MPPFRARALAPLLLLLLVCACVHAGSTAPQPPSQMPHAAAMPPPTPDTATTDSVHAYDSRGVRIAGLPPLVFCGLAASAALGACAALGAARRRCAAAAALREHHAAATARAVAQLTASGFNAPPRLPPVRGIPLALPYPPVRGQPAYEVLGRELHSAHDATAPGRTADGMTFRVIRTDRWESSIAVAE